VRELEREAPEQRRRAQVDVVGEERPVEDELCAGPPRRTAAGSAIRRSPPAKIGGRCGTVAPAPEPLVRTAPFAAAVPEKRNRTASGVGDAGSTLAPPRAIHFETACDLAPNAGTSCSHASGSLIVA
jgi:hypothetical protein